MRTTAAIKDWLTKTFSTLTVRSLCHILQHQRLNKDAVVNVGVPGWQGYERPFCILCRVSVIYFTL